MQYSYQSQPKKEIKDAMDYKQRAIRESQQSKEESIRIQSSGRDAVLIVTSLIEVNGRYFTNDEQTIKDKILEWRNWLYSNVYHMTEEEYKSLNSPF
jgi:hypothetical protein